MALSISQRQSCCKWAAANHPTTTTARRPTVRLAPLFCLQKIGLLACHLNNARLMLPWPESHLAVALLRRWCFVDSLPTTRTCTLPLHHSRVPWPCRISLRMPGSMLLDDSSCRLMRVACCTNCEGFVELAAWSADQACLQVVTCCKCWINLPQRRSDERFPHLLQSGAAASCCTSCSVVSTRCETCIYVAAVLRFTESL